MPHTLDARAESILKSIIAHYILNGEPVGSRTIAKENWEGLSPASIRNVMADLEEMGLLAQPHTSAGRIPTDLGYRHYVDRLAPGGPLDEGDRARIDRTLARSRGELSEAMELVPRLLSALTSQVGLFLSPPPGKAVLKHIEFVRLHARRVLVVFVDSAEVVSHRVLDTEEDHAQEDLDRAGRYLVAEFAQMPLGEIRRRLVLLMAEEKAAFDRMMRDAATLGTRYLDAEAGERKVVLDGATNIMNHPELANHETMRRLFETFEEKHRLVKLLDRYLDRDGVRVVIGSEAADPVMDRLSLVASPYRLADGAGGWIGILGPTRMEYERAVRLMNYISRLLSDLLTHPID